MEKRNFVTDMRPKCVTKLRRTRPVGRPRKYRTNAARQRAYRQRHKRRQPVWWRSACQTRETPQDFFDRLDAEFHFTLDVCALPENAKCARYYTPADDGLQQAWSGICWANPPYGLVLRQWVKKAYESAQAGATVVCLLPIRTDTVWWHDYVLPYAEVRFLRRRLTFGGAKHAAPFPCAVVIFRPADTQEK